MKRFARFVVARVLLVSGAIAFPFAIIYFGILMGIDAAKACIVKMERESKL